MLGYIMGVPRRKDLIRSRRRVKDEEEEEEDSGAVAVEEDSLSEGSAISDADDDADGEGSDGDDTSSPIPDTSKEGPVANGHREKPEDTGPQPDTNPNKIPLATDLGDTDAMLNGLKISGTEDEGVAFEDLGNQAGVQVPEDVVQGSSEFITGESLGEKRRREHEEYKKKRDADPAFVPNRGGFFMHDHRSAAPGQNGFRPFGRGRGRGRGAVKGPFSPSRYVMMTYMQSCLTHYQAACR